MAERRHTQVVKRLALLAAAALTLAAAAGVAAAPGALPDCVGKLQVKPRSVVFTCADAGFGAQKLDWIAWGGKTAAAIGQASVNDCTPTCVAGHFHTFRIVLVVTGSQHCPGGRTAYKTVTYGFLGNSPFGPKDPGTTDPSYSFRCR
jgi:hypothetical protein